MEVELGTDKTKTEKLTEERVREIVREEMKLAWARGDAIRRLRETEEEPRPEETISVT